MIHPQIHLHRERGRCLIFEAHVPEPCAQLRAVATCNRRSTFQGIRKAMYYPAQKRARASDGHQFGLAKNLARGNIWPLFV
jgi:hypothetical protein